MKQIGYWLAVLPLCTLMMGMAPVSGTPETIAADLAAHPPADLDAYYALKTRLGDKGLAAVRLQVTFQMKQQTGLTLSTTCLPDTYVIGDAGFALALASANDAEWKTNRDEVEQAVAEFNRVHDRVMTGDIVDPTYGDAQKAVARATAASAGSRAREFAMRVAEDQFQRDSNLIRNRRRLWANDLSPAAFVYISQYNLSALCRTDQANTAWLKGDLEAHGWPKVSTDGKDMADDAWLLVQHADHDVDFQRKVLAMLGALLPAREVSLHDYALLYDRVATHDGRPQRYGTQGLCIGAGQWQPNDVEDPANLDARRAAAGMPSEALVINQMGPRCFASPAAPAK